MTTPDTGILTTILRSYQSIFGSSIYNLRMWTNYLMGSLMIIDLTYAMLFKADDKDVLKILIQKIVFYGMFAIIIGNFSAIMSDVLNGFVKVGLKAGGNKISAAMVSDPSAIAEFGIKLSEPIWNQIKSFEGMSAMSHIGTILTSTIFALLIMASFGLMGIQFFLCWLEFYIVGGLTLIFIPFGVCGPTSFLSESAFRTVIAFGVKLMVLSFIACASITVIKTWQLPDDCTLQQMMYALLGSASMAFLCWEAPKLAAGLMAGSPNLSLMSAVSTIAGAAFATHAAGRAASNILKPIGSGLKAMGAVTQAVQHGIRSKGGFKGAMAGMGRLAATNSSFSQGRQETQRRMQAHARAMKSAGMRDRLGK